MSLAASRNEMIIRNMARTYRVPVSDVRGFDISGRTRNGVMIRVLTGTQAFPAEVTAINLHSTKRVRARQERQLQDLISWLGRAV